MICFSRMMTLNVELRTFANEDGAFRRQLGLTHSDLSYEPKTKLIDDDGGFNEILSRLKLREGFSTFLDASTISESDFGNWIQIGCAEFEENEIPEFAFGS
jgi:hypothetical protein